MDSHCGIPSFATAASKWKNASSHTIEHMFHLKLERTTSTLWLWDKALRFLIYIPRQWRSEMISRTDHQAVIRESIKISPGSLKYSLQSFNQDKAHLPKVPGPRLTFKRRGGTVFLRISTAWAHETECGKYFTKSYSVRLSSHVVDERLTLLGVCNCTIAHIVQSFGCNWSKRQIQWHLIVPVEYVVCLLRARWLLMATSLVNLWFPLGKAENFVQNIQTEKH